MVPRWYLYADCQPHRCGLHSDFRATASREAYGWLTTGMVMGGGWGNTFDSWIFSEKFGKIVFFVEIFPKLTFLFCIMYKSHNSYFVVFVMFVNVVILGFLHYIYFVYFYLL